MPVSRIPHGDHRDKKKSDLTSRVKSHRLQPTAPDPESVQLAAEETVREANLGGQADLLANLQFLPAQRSSLAAQIGQVQGNRHLGQVLSAARHSDPNSGGNHLAIQRQDTPTTAHRTVRFGSEGPDVEEAQTKLNEAGADPPLAVDGIFGPLTRAAVINFQNGNNLAPDGIVGPLTWGALDQTGGGTDVVGPDVIGPDVIGPEVQLVRWADTDTIRLAAQTSDTGPLNAYQASRAELRIYALSDPEYSNLRSLLDQAGSDMEWAFLLKAAAAQRSISDITIFANRIRGMSQRWLMRNLMVVDLVNDLTAGANPEERGIIQQYGNSCGPTSVQLIHAQADPIYALELRSAGPIDKAPDNAVSNPETVTNQQLANEQAGILNAHHAKGEGNAPTNRTNPTGGAWVETDMNALANATGVTYTTKIIGAGISMDDAISALQNGLASGVQVPIIVGGGSGASNTSHYVVVLIASGDRFLVHDVATGQSVWRTLAQFRGNTLDLPSGWNFFVAIDVPTLVPPPLPQPPAPSTG